MDLFPSFSEIPKIVIWDQSLLCVLCLILIWVLLWFWPVAKRVKWVICAVVSLGLAVVSFLTLFFSWELVFFSR